MVAILRQTETSEYRDLCAAKASLSSMMSISPTPICNCARSFLGRRHRPDPHHAGCNARRGDAGHPCPDRQSQPARHPFGSNDHGGRAVIDPGRIASCDGAPGRNAGLSWLVDLMLFQAADAHRLLPRSPSYRFWPSVEDLLGQSSLSLSASHPMLTSQRHRILIAAADVIFVGDISAVMPSGSTPYASSILGFTSLHPIVVSASPPGAKTPPPPSVRRKESGLCFRFPPQYKTHHPPRGSRVRPPQQPQVQNRTID